MTPPEWHNSPLITHELLPTSQYRELIKRSKIILDSNAAHQDGLTARFMWALGEEAKIVTTNVAVKKYDFYTLEQIYVIDNIDSFSPGEDFDEFVKTPLIMQKDHREIIRRYRIDNWINTLFNGV